MHRLRLLVLWIMMIAVPFQGYAAVAMAFCGPGHAAAMTGVPAASADPHGHAGHAQGDAHAAHHHEAKSPAKVEHAKTAGIDHDSQHKCGTCGACHGTALVSELHLAVFHALPPAELAEPFFAMATLAPRVLDKPPRS
ncbi:hypothetical protein [Variovorax saccharolyticus]|uniref:hypothetical protein n=1 Tax=Variovorax saccharolyticus TaxID=3053516 RepID=UPI0025791CD7|nr:hypothetical protein [Variovorax sp. J22R187]MDM0022008.1 hypothetical protein [Variovorax sp. J22R187]